MNTEQHKEHLLNGKFLMVCSGESYFTSVVKGPDIINQMMTAMCGEDEKNWPAGEKDFWQEHVNDPDNWCHDQDHGPTRFNLDVGETDHIELFLLTHDDESEKLTQFVKARDAVLADRDGALKKARQEVEFLSDKCGNFLAAASLQMPAHIHAEALSGGMADIKAKLDELLNVL